MKPLEDLLKQLGKESDTRTRAELCRRALALVTGDENPLLWAALQGELGYSLAQDPLGERADNLERAIAHYQQTLTVYTREAFPADWAATQYHLAAAYSDRIGGERADNLERAIAHYQQTLTVYTREAFPADWAATQYHLAAAYSDRIGGERADNLERAIAHYQQALTVRTREAFPADWAATQHNLANAYGKRICGERADNLERAIAHYQQALTVYTREAFPADWAATQYHLAAAYSDRIGGERADNLERAIEHYDAALTVRTREAFPADWAATQHNLGLAYAKKATGDRAHNLKTASDIFIHIQGTLERLGSVRGVAEARVALADVLAVSTYDDQEIQLALASYHQAFEMLRRIGDEHAAEKIADKIKALETVNFTTYYPRTGVPGRKYGLVVYAHLPELRNDVNLDAQKFSAELGDSMPTPRRSRSNVKLARDTPITVVPECSDVKFDPSELTKRWDGSLTRFLFDFELDLKLVGEVILVRISIQVAGIEIACISNCAIEVIESQQCDADENPLAHAKSDNQTSTLYQRIFVSYARRDREITERYKLAQIALGNEAFIDVDNLRAGENWKAGLARAIDVADVFQLFWSWNSAKSEYCRHEWTYALEFRCPDSKCEGFIRPVYWEKPMPDPPPELSHVNFKYVPFGGNARLEENRDEVKRSGQGRDA